MFQDRWLLSSPAGLATQPLWTGKELTIKVALRSAWVPLVCPSRQSLCWFWFCCFIPRTRDWDSTAAFTHTNLSAYIDFSFTRPVADHITTTTAAENLDMFPEQFLLILPPSFLTWCRTFSPPPPVNVQYKAIYRYRVHNGRSRLRSGVRVSASFQIVALSDGGMP